MVAFCHECSQSLPFADVVIEDGREEPAPGYRCPHCDQPANQEESAPEENDQSESIPDQLLIKDGKIFKPSDS